MRKKCSRPYEWPGSVLGLGSACSPVLPVKGLGKSQQGRYGLTLEEFHDALVRLIGFTKSPCHACAASALSSTRSTEIKHTKLDPNILGLLGTGIAFNVNTIIALLI